MWPSIMGAWIVCWISSGGGNGMDRRGARLLALVLSGISLLGAGSAQALPFGRYDARTVGLAGVGVATGSQSAAFNNPALLTTADEIHEWFVLLPAATYEVGDPDELKDGLEAFQDAAAVLEGDPSAANRTEVQNRLDAMQESVYQEEKSLSVLVAIPSRILSGAAFLNIYKRYNTQASIGGDDLNDPPSYASTLKHRGIRVLENGFSAAKLLEDRKAWWDGISLGFSVKMQLVEGYGYATNIRTAETELDANQRRNGSAFNLDLGIHREWGVWNLGLVGKNLFPTKFDLGDTGEQVELGPQWRLGLAYQGRLTMLELDVDLMENKALGFEGPNQVAALGWEQNFGRWFAFRLGYEKNLVGTEAGSASLGLGFVFGAFHLDLAGQTGDELDGVSAQLGFTF